MWPSGFSGVCAGSLPLDGALVGVCETATAAHRKGCQESDKDDVSG